MPQTLRLCERRWLLWPAGTSGGTRWYSQHNLDRLRRIAELLQAGLNLAGIALVLTWNTPTPNSAPTPASTQTTRHPQREQDRSGPRGPRTAAGHDMRPVWPATRTLSSKTSARIR